MVTNKSLDPLKQIIAALLCDVQTSHSEVFTPRALRLTTLKVVNRIDREGSGFLTKTLPRLGKALDRALSGEVQLDSASLAFTSLPNSKLPRFLGELFQLIFSHDGRVLPVPCVRSIKTLRQILFVFYKYELPYDADQEQDVISKFSQTEKDILPYHQTFSLAADLLDADVSNYNRIFPITARNVIRRARKILASLFSTFDHRDIYPRHGPGAVATKEQLWDKYTWSSISPRITSSYPLDQYFYCSLGHVCDEFKAIQALTLKENPAKVILVPKDSRGPRLISCEPLDFQWIQQGLGSAIVRHIERHPLTRYNVHFSDQQPNRFGAIQGSITGLYATLDLKEASDRVTVGLVRLLFPHHLSEVLLNCRSQSTVLPGGEELKLNKFAPMGSALCFPILALTCWAILVAGLTDAKISQLKKSEANLLVYGDDVIVPTAQAANAICLLESFGLKVNRDKSCTSGFFRESCGMDAYKGVDVTPVRFRTVWTHRRCPDTYTSWVAYANQMYRAKYFNTYEYIVRELCKIYKQIPEMSMGLSPCVSLIEVPEAHRPTRTRINRNLQKREWFTWHVKSRQIFKEIDGWKMLMRFHAEANSVPSPWSGDESRRCDAGGCDIKQPFSVRSYTKRRVSILTRRWQ
jgi:hypothetical protein